MAAAAEVAGGVRGQRSSGLVSSVGAVASVRPFTLLDLDGYAVTIHDKC
jgi:hypothetical protein